MIPFYSTIEESIKGTQNVEDLGLFILCCLVMVSLVLFSLFYFNRVAARLITLVVNQYLWRRYEVYIQLDSVRVTLLGARILFKNFRIHCTDASLTVHQGHITLQYWLFDTRKSNSSKDDTKLPCRIVCNVEGVEGYIYNNVFFYQQIKGILGLGSEDTPSTQQSVDSYVLNGTPNVLDPENQTLSEMSWLQKFLPIQLECTTAAFIIGNQQLESYVVLKTAQASGTIDIGPSRTTMDYCKATIDLVLRKPQVSLEKNEQYTKGHQHVNSLQHYQRTHGWWKYVYQWIQWALFTGRATDHTKDTELQLHQEEKDHSEQQQQPLPHPIYHTDYAKVENIVECSQLALCYYMDIPGPVRNTILLHDYNGNGPDIGNGGLPPECGARISLWNAVVNYGPWADKQRLAIQDYFVPNPHRTNVPTGRLLPGEARMATSFDLMVDFMTEAKLRIPTREISKDWKYTGGVSHLDIEADGYYTRPYGWLDVKIKEESSIKILTPLIISSDGYLATLDLDVKEVEVATSVNYANIVRADGLKAHIDMPFPLIWNEHRVWTLDVAVKKPDVFLLRDHVFLLQDLVKDWIAIATPVNLLHFIPITYQIQLDASQASVYLCVNEHNIINYPNSMDDNAFLDIHVQKVRFNAALPLVTYQPEVMSVKYSAQLDQIHGGLSLQPSHTRSAFMNEDDSEIFSCRSVSLQGSHETYTSLDVLRHIESVSLNVKIQGAMVKLFGLVVRYLIILQRNYAGNALHFCTIDEYRQRRSNPNLHVENRKKELEAKPLSDPFEFTLVCQIEDVAALLPENLYECSHYSQLEFQELQLELRNLDIYTDMYVTISPLTWTRDCNPNPTTRRSQFKIKNGRDPHNFLYVDGINLHAHRLFGPLPETATYLCHWEFDIGNVKGEIKPSFLIGAANFAQTFIYNLIDEDNTVSSELLGVMGSTGYPDVSFATVNIKPVDVCLMTQNSATQLQLQDGVSVEFDNLTNEKYNQRISTQLPAISIICLANQEQGDQQQDMTYSWVEVARVELGLNLTIFRHTKEWKKHRAAQQQFIQHQDSLTGRCKHLYERASETKGPTRTSSAKSAHDHHVGVLYAPLFQSAAITQNKTQHQSNNKIASGYETGYSVMSTEAMHGGQYLLYSDDDDDDDDEDIDNDGDDYSMMSFTDQWPNLSNALKSAIHSVSPYNDDENDSFRTADFEIEDNHSHDLTSTSSSHSLGTNYTKSIDEASVNSPMESENEGFDTGDQLGYRVTVIPPSIPYSGYLNRYAVKRAANLVGRGQSFFHPYVPPPKTTFIPLKAKTDKQDKGFSERSTHFFADLEEDELDAKLSSDDKNNNNSNQQSDVVITSVLEATLPVKVLVTPILVKVVQEMTEVINKDDWDLETMLDSTQIEYVGQLTRYLTDQFICVRFAFWLPSTHLHFIQNVMIPADLPSYNKHTQDQQSQLQTLYDNQGDMLCTMDIFMDDLQMIGGLTFQDYAFRQKQISVSESNLVLEESRMHINLGDLGCKVHYVSDCYDNQRQVMFGIPKSRQHVHGRYDLGNDINGEPKMSSDSNSDSTSSFGPAATELVVLDLRFDNFCCKWLGAKKPNYLNFGINEVSTIIITESVEILLGAAYSWLGFMDDLQRIHTRFQSRRSHQMQVLLYELAQFSSNGGPSIGGNSSGSAPQFLTIPTSMGLRIGSKKNFRNDVGWKLLARMRQCLREMPLTLREKLQYRLTLGGAIERVDSVVMFGKVVRALSSWRSWEIDSKDIENCRLFTKTFSQQQIKTNIKTKDCLQMGLLDDPVSYLKNSVNCGKFKVNRFDFCIYEEEPDAYDNHIIVEPVEFTSDTIYKTSPYGTDISDKPPPQSSSASSTSSSGASVTSEGYLDVIGKLEIGSIDISVNPTILAFARHMLTVQWVFTNKLKNLSNNGLTASPSSVPTAQQQPVHVLDIKHLLSRIDVVAHALIRIQHIHLGAWAQKLTMKNDINGIYGSVVFSNPKLSPLANNQQHHPSEKGSDTGSGKRSSNRTYRKQSASSNSNRVIVNASGGIESLDIGFYELVSLGSYWDTNAANNNSTNINKKPGFNTTARQLTKRIDTKLLAMKVTDAKINATVSQTSSNRSNKKSRSSSATMDTICKSKEILNILTSVGAVDINVPQSLLRLYSFVEEWRSEQGKRYNFMFQNLINEWEEHRRLDSLVTPQSHQLNGDEQQKHQGMGILSVLSPELWCDIKFQFLLVKCIVKADLLRSLSIKYSIGDLLVLGDETPLPQTAPVIKYAIQLSNQAIDLITHHGSGDINKSHLTSTIPPLLNHGSTSSAFNLPGIRTSGTLIQVANSTLGGKTEFQLQASLSVDLIAMSLDVSMIDSILTAHNLLENEVSELVEILSYSKKGQGRKLVTNRKEKAALSPYAPFKYSVGISLDGLSIKVLSPLTTGLFESSALEASLSNYSTSPSSHQHSLMWNVSGSNLSLSLDHGGSTAALWAPHQQKVDDRTDIKRRNRLAYFVVDFHIHNRLVPANGDTPDQHITSYDVVVTKVQAVMQPIALGKLVDMYIYYDSELKKKKEIKREEIEQLAINTKRIVESFHSDSVILKKQDIQKLLQGRQFSLIIEKLGAAIPLSDMMDDLATAQTPSTINGQQQQHRHNSALLFTLSSLCFTTKSMTTTSATINGMSLQFVKRFDQLNEDHFSASNHPRMNQVRLPIVTCLIDTTFEKVSRKLGVQVEAKVLGCYVELDGSIGDYINRLGVIYQKSVRKFDTLPLMVKHGTFLNNHSDKNSAMDAIHSCFPDDLIHLDVEGNFDYDITVIRLYPKRKTGENTRKRGKSTNGGSTRGQGSISGGKYHSSSSDMTTIKLPRLTAAYKYQAPLSYLNIMSDIPHRLHLDLLIHESNNILQPSLVQFVQEVTDGLKQQYTQLDNQQQITLGRTKLGSTSFALGIVDNIDASIILRLSKSTLEFTCQPASKVVCSLILDDGELMLHSFYSTGEGRTTTCFGALRHISMVVKHPFSPQPCLGSNINHIALNAALLPTIGNDGAWIKDSLSVTIKIPSVQGEINMRHLQDLLILNSCWLSQPMLQQDQGKPSQNQQLQHSFPVICASYLTLVVDKVVLAADMGQAIGKLTLSPNHLSLHAHIIPGVSQGIGLSLQSVLITSEGRLAGEAKLHRIILEASVNIEPSSTVSTPGQFYLSTDGFRANFTHEYQHILELVLEHTRVTTTVDRMALGQGYRHKIKTSVYGGRLIATISVKTFPVMVVIHKRFTELVEKKQDEAEAIFISWIHTKHDDDLLAEPTISTSLPSGFSMDSSPLPPPPPQQQQQLNDQQWPLSFVEVCVEQIQLIIYPSQFQDGDNLEVQLVQVKATLHQASKVDNQGVYRNILVTTDKGYLLKNVPGQEIMKKRKQGLENAAITRTKNATDEGGIGIDEIGKGGSDNYFMDGNETSGQQHVNAMVQPVNEMGTFILGLPNSKIGMESTQVKWTVHHTSTVDFMDHLGVSLNLGQLKYIQDLIWVFNEQMTRAQKTVDSIGETRASYMTSNYEVDEDDQHNDGDDTTSLDSGIGVGDIITEPQQHRQQRQSTKCTATEFNDLQSPDLIDGGTNSATYKNGDKQVLVYIADKIIHFDPKIRQVGDATLPVEWLLGIKREWIPELLHENITLPLDQMVHRIWNIYQMQTQNT
ncbi:hypothetical protein BC941DRAFT_508242 [Chlamydoabsidia padenii]|nr:hypothetical protein BC941DRAFT_508242 [Chlamydoabsidia padenii]